MTMIQNDQEVWYKMIMGQNDYDFMTILSCSY